MAKKDFQKWTDGERKKMLEMKEERKSWREIGKILDRTPRASEGQFRVLQKKGLAPYALEKYDVSELHDYYKKFGHSKTIEKYGSFSVKYLQKLGLWKRKRKIVVKKFDTFLSHKDRWYWAGFIAADGCVHKTKNRVSIGLSIKDIDHLHKIHHLLGGSIWKNEVKADWSIYSATVLKEFLLSLNITMQKTFSLRPPLLVLEERIRGYIRGYFDGDGSVSICKYTKKANKKRYYTPNLQFLGTEDILGWIKKNLEKYACVGTNHKICKHKRIKSLNYGSKQEILNVLNWMYEDADIYLDRKFHKSEEVKKFIKNG